MTRHYSQESSVNEVLSGITHRYLTTKNITIFALVGLIGACTNKLLDTGKDGREGRIFSEPYESVIEKYLAQNPNYNKQYAAEYRSDFFGHFGKGGNMPYESVPLIQTNNGGMIDAIWPQSNDPKHNISLRSLLNRNQIADYYLPLINDILVAEAALMTNIPKSVRQYAPDFIEESIGRKAPSESAMRVKETFKEDFKEEQRIAIVDAAMKMEMITADRSRVMTNPWAKNDSADGLQGGYKFLFQILKYPDHISARKDFLSGKINTKTEVGIAMGIQILKYIQNKIEKGEQDIGIVRDKNGEITANFPQSIYSGDILPVIQKVGGYNSIVNNNVSPGSSEAITLIKSKIIAIDAQLKDKNKSTIYRKKRLEEKKRLQNELGKIQNKFAAEKQSIIRTISSSHLTVTKDDLNKVGVILSDLNRAATFYPTNINRAFGENGTGTYEQFMVNVLEFNAAFGNKKIPKYLKIDGDPGEGTRQKLEEYGIGENVDLSTRIGIYKNSLSNSIQNVVGWNDEIDNAIKGKGIEDFSQNLINFMNISFEHKYITVQVIHAYLNTLLSEKIGDKDMVMALQKDVSDAWMGYIKYMDQSKLNAIMLRIANPEKFHEQLGFQKDNRIKRFYTSWLIPRLLATTIHMHYARIAIPEIQQKGTNTQNITNTIFRGNMTTITNLPKNILVPNPEKIGGQSFSKIPVTTKAKVTKH